MASLSGHCRVLLVGSWFLSLFVLEKRCKIWVFVPVRYHPIGIDFQVNVIPVITGNGTAWNVITGNGTAWNVIMNNRTNRIPDAIKQLVFDIFQHSPPFDQILKRSF